MSKKMTIWGVGGQLSFWTLFYAIHIVVIDRLQEGRFQILFIPESWRYLIAAVLGLLGIVLLMASGRTLSKGFHEGKLLTTGLYACCQHPLYAAWNLLIVPAMSLAYGSWIALSIPFAMYLIFRFLIRKEEDFLREKFGKEYEEYTQNVGRLFPKFSFFFRKEGRG